MKAYHRMNDKTISHLITRNVLGLASRNTDAEIFASSGCRVNASDIHRKGDGTVWFDPATSVVDAVQLTALYCTKYERYATIDESDGLTYVQFNSHPTTVAREGGNASKCRAICEAILHDHARLRAKKPSP